MNIAYKECHSYDGIVGTRAHWVAARMRRNGMRHGRYQLHHRRLPLYRFGVGDGDEDGRWQYIGERRRGIDPEAAITNPSRRRYATLWHIQHFFDTHSAVVCSVLFCRFVLLTGKFLFLTTLKQKYRYLNWLAVSLFAGSELGRGRKIIKMTKSICFFK